ncbi:XRE family transcriptional regulator [Streptomyces carpaticus]|uniref:XRE family transcriptional regulator n=1 Tax=Streptomyces TaxID=1883 RepID=UPI0021FAF600|nr:XRE family transcriptional regulator [Streptomyces carpaticus]
MEGIGALGKRMREAGFTQVELADAINTHLRADGHEGTVSDRTVRNWLTGKTRWPHERQRAALEAVFNCPVTELGFIPRRVSLPHAPSEDSVRRRRFIATSAAAALAATNTPVFASQKRFGMSDVERLQTKFAALIATDFRYGGRRTIETQAVELAEEALTIQNHGTATQRVRGALYGCAASFTSSAMWAAIDGRRFDAAQRHFHRASSLAAMSNDSTIQFRIWSHAGSLYRHMNRPADALAANDVARSLPITRRDSMFACLGHARQAAIHGMTNDSHAVQQTLGHAQDAFERADTTELRPVWMTAVCDRAELETLALSAHLSLGDFEKSEAHAHRSLSLLRPAMQRDRGIVTARLALAQLGQGELESAVNSAVSIPGDIARHPRVGILLREFGELLHVAAPSSQPARSWDEHARESQKGIS